MRPLFLLLVCACLVAGCGNSAPARTPASGGSGRPAPREVAVARATEDRLVRTIAVTGTLAAEEQVTLSFKSPGRLAQLGVDLGSRVTMGQAIARLTQTDVTLRVSQADAALQQARARLGLPPQGTDDAVQPEHTAIVRSAKAMMDEARLTKQRIDTFVKKGIAARADLDAAEAGLQVAESRHQDAIEEVRNRQALLQQRRTELELARQAVRDSSLTSALDGIVRERHASVGQFLAAGAPVVTVVRVHPLRLRAAIPEREAHAIRTRQEVHVTVEGDPLVYQGRIVRVSPAIDEGSRTLMIEAEVPNPGGVLRPGSFATASIETAAQDKVLLVPASALVTFAGVDKVLTVKEGRIAEKRVTIGTRDGGRVEIVSGLTAGDAVVVQPGNLVEGAPVRVVGSRAGSGSAPSR